MTSDKATQEDAHSLIPVLLLVLAGPLTWAAHLLVIYGSTTVICTHTVRAGAVLPVVAAATIVALAALGVIAIRSWRRSDVLGRGPAPHRFLRRVMLLLLLLSAVGIVWAGSTVLMLPACSSTDQVAARPEHWTRSTIDSWNFKPRSSVNSPPYRSDHQA